MKQTKQIRAQYCEMRDYKILSSLGVTFMQEGRNLKTFYSDTIKLQCSKIETNDVYKPPTEHHSNKKKYIKLCLLLDTF